MICSISCRRKFAVVYNRSEILYFFWSCLHWCMTVEVSVAEETFVQIAGRLPLPTSYCSIAVGWREGSYRPVVSGIFMLSNKLWGLGTVPTCPCPHLLTVSQGLWPFGIPGDRMACSLALSSSRAYFITHRGAILSFACLCMQKWFWPIMERRLLCRFCLS